MGVKRRHKSSATKFTPIALSFDLRFKYRCKSRANYIFWMAMRAWDFIWHRWPV